MIADGVLDGCTVATGATAGACAANTVQAPPKVIRKRAGEKKRITVTFVERFVLIPFSPHALAGIEHLVFRLMLFGILAFSRKRKFRSDALCPEAG
jgi:hypothetical protein